MNNQPLVSVICLCYNQADFVEEAIQSVFDQDYTNVELIIVDDASSDDSQEVIRKKVKNSNAQLIALKSNVGMCCAFNIAFKKSKGEFIIDLAADDRLLSQRVSLGVEDFQKRDGHVGVHFSDAWICDQHGQELHTFYNRNERSELLESIPEGDIYLHLISTYFICAPTMMTRRSVLEKMNGYDEKLIYEDFDFWIRSSRDFGYIFNNEPLVKKLDRKKSDSKNQFRLRTKHTQSTWQVCNKIFALNQTKEEDDALIIRCRYEIVQCLKTLNVEYIFYYLRLIRKARKRQFSV